MSLVQLTLVGRVGKDAEVKMTPQGKELVVVSCAAGSKDKSQWFNVQAWEKNAVWLKDAKKGDQIWASGTMNVRTYEKKLGGVGVDVTLVAQQVRLFSKTPKSNDVPEMTSNVSAMDFDEDVPF